MAIFSSTIQYTLAAYCIHGSFNLLIPYAYVVLHTTSLSPLVTTSLFSVSVSQFLFFYHDQNVVCHISKQRMLQPSSHYIKLPRMWALSPEGTQDGDKWAAGCPLPSPSSRQLLQPSQICTWENSGYWPQIAEVHIKGMVLVSPDSCICPYIENC